MNDVSWTVTTTTTITVTIIFGYVIACLFQSVF